MCNLVNLSGGGDVYFWVDLARLLISVVLALYGIYEYRCKRMKGFLYLSCGFALLAISDFVQWVYPFPVGLLLMRVIPLIHLSLYAAFAILIMAALRKTESS